MSNSAARLARLLQTWNDGPAVAGEAPTIMSKRRHNPVFKESEQDFWHEQAIAVRLLQDVEQAMTGLAATGSNVTAYRESVPDWYELIFFPRENWEAATGPPDPRNFQTSLRMLRALGGLLDELALDDDPLPEDGVSILSALRDAETLVREEETLPRAGRAYLLALIDQAIFYCVNVDEYGGLSFGAQRTKCRGRCIALPTLVSSRPSAPRPGAELPQL